MENFIQTLLDAAAVTGALVDLPNGSEACVVVPKDYKIESVERFLATPVRKKGTVSFAEAESFARYVKEFNEPGTRIFANLSESGGTFTAILNYHRSDSDLAGWKDHRAVYLCPATVEWKRWLGMNQRQTDQETFARFLEENQQDIVSPPGAVILEVATTLQARTNVEFKSGVRLDNGNQQLIFEETTDAKAGAKGEVTIPSQFQIGIPLFVGGPRYALNARLRYRIVNKKVVFWFDLINPHLAVKDALDELTDSIAEKTGLEPFLAVAD